MAAAVAIAAEDQLDGEAIDVLPRRVGAGPGQTAAEAVVAGRGIAEAAQPAVVGLTVHALGVADDVAGDHAVDPGIGGRQRRGVRCRPDQPLLLTTPQR